ncbi:DUF488 domain-containing protein [Clostridium felsineum]|uniref:Uncharacterized protein n=1 Tax=Clostridium felsineum TaxID=36839 RepID=A0A1S8LYL5_9CLOT|nr:DUF488 domain-containing protein [Clostridium felsineum]URZ07527.1 hypothetical protein CLROS_028660 [Clostridium felsineum]URZ12558.1 hypothetical protein CROST_032810 [Clostridium felsineum]
MDIYTIGHSTYNIDYFIELLKRNNINCIIDVRSTPYSKYGPQYNRETLKKTLNGIGIYYIFMGKEFGARRDNKELYAKEGYLDFEKTRFDQDFKDGVVRVKNGIGKGYRIAFMCTEKDPFDCHRCILVAREFKDMGLDVKNILSDGSFITQKDIETRLLQKYFPNRNQMTLFNLKNTSEEKLLKDAYKLRNSEIGYKINGNED